MHLLPQSKLNILLIKHFINFSMFQILNKMPAAIYLPANVKLFHQCLGTANFVHWPLLRVVISKSIAFWSISISLYFLIQWSVQMFKCTWHSYSSEGKQNPGLGLKHRTCSLRAVCEYLLCSTAWHGCKKEVWKVYNTRTGPSYHPTAKNES